MAHAHKHFQMYKFFSNLGLGQEQVHIKLQPCTVSVKEKNAEFLFVRGLKKMSF